MTQHYVLYSLKLATNNESMTVPRLRANDGTNIPLRVMNPGESVFSYLEMAVNFIKERNGASVVQIFHDEDGSDGVHTFRILTEPDD